MRGFSRAIASLAFAIGLAGCTGEPDVRDWRTIRPEEFKQILPGHSTKEDIHHLFGRPMLVTIYERQKEEVWDYRFIDGIDTWLLWVHYDPGGTVKRYETVLPRLYESGAKESGAESAAAALHAAPPAGSPGKSR